MKSIRICLGENVRRLRRARSMTQGELAAACELSLSFLQSIESGKKWISAETIECLAQNLEVRESELFIDHSWAGQLEPAIVLKFLAEALGVEVEVRARAAPAKSAARI